MNAYEQINCLNDIGIVAGSSVTFYIDIIDENGGAVDLSKVTSYGCKINYYGTKKEAATATSTIDEDKSNRMKVVLSSSSTESLGGKCLEYIPFVTANGETFKYGKGRLVVGIG